MIDKESIIYNVIKELSIVIVIDFILLWLWVYFKKPDDSSQGIDLIFTIPPIVILNIILALVFTFMQKKSLIIVFLINILLCPLFYTIIYTYYLHLQK